MSDCGVIHQRHDATWSDDTLDLLARFATGHADPQPGQYAITRPRNSDRDGDSGDRPDVAMSAIDCVAAPPRRR